MENEKGFVDKFKEQIKGLLNNLPLLMWVKKYSADNLTINKGLCEKLGIDTGKESLMIMDESNVKAFITDSVYNDKKHTTINFSELVDVVKTLGNKELADAKLIVREEKNQPVIISLADRKACVIISPVVDDEMVDVDNKVVPKEEKKSNKKDKDEEGAVDELEDEEKVAVNN